MPLPIRMTQGGKGQDDQLATNGLFAFSQEWCSVEGSVSLGDRELLRISEAVLTEFKEKGEISNFTVGTVASGDCFVEDDATSRRLREELHASCVEMEGAAVSQTCLIHKVPFLVVRSISDFADGNAGMTYDQFSGIAADRSGKVMKEIIKRL